MPDEADVAQHAESLFLAESLRAAQPSQALGQKECADCGSSIPELRRQACPWATRCVPCQAEHDLGSD